MEQMGRKLTSNLFNFKKEQQNKKREGVITERSSMALRWEGLTCSCSAVEEGSDGHCFSLDFFFFFFPAICRNSSSVKENGLQLLFCLSREIC
jgi:hypothetical protein